MDHADGMGNHSNQSVVKINLVKAVQPMIKGEIKGCELNCFLDTGAALSLITTEGLNKLKRSDYKKSNKEMPKLTDVNDHPIKTTGMYEVVLKFGKHHKQVTMVACENIMIPCPILLGMDTIQKFGMELDFENNQVLIGKTVNKMFFNNDENLMPVIKVIRSKDQTKHKFRIRSRGNQIIPAHSKKILNVSTVDGSGKNLLFVPDDQFTTNIQIGIIQLCKDGKASIEVINNSGCSLTIPPRKVLGKAREIDVAEVETEWGIQATQILGIKEDTQNKKEHQGLKLSEEEVKKQLDPFLDCAEEHKDDLLKILSRHREAVALPGEPVGSTHLIELSLKLQEGTKPIALAPYKIPHAKQALLDAEIDKLLKEGIICPTVSPWASPVVLVTKPDSSVRLCVDYRRLNLVTESDSYPLPVIEDIVMELGNSKVFSQIDLLQAYHQVPCAPGTAELTGFRVYRGHYMYLKAPFGLKQMPSVFQRLMNLVFNVNPTKNYVATYLDDVLVHSDSVEDHLGHLEDVLVKLEQAGLKLKLKKCSFFKEKVKYLGYELTSEGFKPQLEKLTAISNFPRPTSVDGIRSFLGMAGYYRIYINGFSSIARPLTDMLKKDKEFEWTEECENSLNTLKQKLTSAPLLAYPDYSRGFIVETDASGIGIGAILSQKDPCTGRLKPIAYASRLLKPAEKNYSTIDREALAVVWALKKFKYVIFGYDITILTDHKPLCSLFVNTLPPGRLGRWALCIQEYGIKIQYKPGKTNLGADALSRYPIVESENDSKSNGMAGEQYRINKTETQGLKTKQPPAAWTINSLIQNQMKDQIFGAIYHYVNFDRDGDKPKVPMGLKLDNFLLAGNILHYKETGHGTREGQSLTKVVVPEVLVPRLLKLYHDLPSAGHRGVEATVTRIEEKYVVHRLREKTKSHIESCTKCVQHRSDSRKGAPFYQYQVIPKPFHQVHFDILGPLPKTENGNSYIIVYVDRFTRYTIIDVLKNRSTKSVAQSLFNRVIAEYSTPAVLISDNALELTSRVIEDLCASFGIRKAEITAYVPSANGLVEVANKRILSALRTAINNSQNDWDQMVPYVQVALNTAYHHAIGDTPHYLVFLEDKILPFERMFGETNGENIQQKSEYEIQRIERKKIAFKAAQDCLLEVEAKYVNKANKKRKATKIREGFRVYIRARTPPKKSPKLYKKWEGPYRVLKDIGRNRFLVKNLLTGQDKVVHADHAKIVPETMSDVSMNPRVKLPHPGLRMNEMVEEEDDDDDILLTFPLNPPDRTMGGDAPSALQSARDTNSGMGGAEQTQAHQPASPEQVRPEGRSQNRPGLRPRTRKPERYGF